MDTKRFDMEQTNSIVADTFGSNRIWGLGPKFRGVRYRFTMESITFCKKMADINTCNIPLIYSILYCQSQPITLIFSLALLRQL